MPEIHGTILYASPFLRLGVFEFPIDAPDFRNTGPRKGYSLAFPQTAVKIGYAGRRDMIIADCNTVTLYNKGQEYEPFAPALL